MRNRNSAPDFSCISSHASSTTTRRGRRIAGLDTRRHTASRVSRVPMPFSSSGRSRRLNTTRCPSGLTLLGPSNSCLNAPSTNGCSRAASSPAARSPACPALASWSRKSRSVGDGRVQVRASAVIPTLW